MLCHVRYAGYASLARRLAAAFAFVWLTSIFDGADWSHYGTMDPATATEKVLVVAPTAIVCYLLWRVLCFTEPAWAVTCRSGFSVAELDARLLDEG